jgi:hypothetical protein
MRRVRQWGECLYVVTDTIELIDQAQAIGVLDITDIPDVARFSNRFPEPDEAQGGYIPDDYRCYVLIVFPDEGHTSVMDESGVMRRVRCADLSIRVVPSSRSDFEQMQQKQMRDLDTFVDNGGHLEI